MKTTNTYGATLIDVMGSDLSVVNAARVSFDKESEWEYSCDECGNAAPMTRYCAATDTKGCASVAYHKPADVRLISYLARNHHWTPFAHPQLTFRVSAPIFVARQLQKHQIGLAWNEVSRRYVDSEPVIYVPAEWRKRPDASIKQGSSDEAVSLSVVYYGSGEWSEKGSIYDKAIDTTMVAYRSLLAQGVCPEQARMVLPQSMMTEWIWTGSLAAFARVCNQRLDPHAQRECRPVAEAIAKALVDNFPVSWAALRKTYDE